MRNQTSFRLTTTLLPTDTTANTTTVINKVDSNGDKFYPHFLDVETVVLTNDDRTVMEITKARCNNWALTFEERWLDDKVNPVTWVEDSIPNRKLTRNPWTLAFITASAGDIIDKDGDIRWEWKQTYADDMTSMWKATYKWRLITEKWVEYPHFDSLEDLQAYTDPFGWMFAVVDASGELYRYNAVTQQRDVITTNTPTNPQQASTTTIWTVRVATDTEFNNWTDQWSNNEYLVATPSQIHSVSPTMHIVDIDQHTDSINTAWQSKSKSYTVTHWWLISVRWKNFATSASIAAENTCVTISYSWTANPVLVSSSSPYEVWWLTAWWSWSNRELIAVWTGTFTVTITVNYTLPSGWYSTRADIDTLIYFW